MDSIFQACFSGWKTRRNSTRLRSISELSYVEGFWVRSSRCDCSQKTKKRSGKQKEEKWVVL